MSLAENVQPETEEALRKTQERIKLVEQSNGKIVRTLTETQRQQWSESVATVFADSACPLEAFLQDLAALPGSITAYGAVSAWPSMSDDRKSAYLRWVDTLGSERSGPQKAVLITKLLRISPATSAELLATVSLANKELKTRLASSLLGDSAREIGFLLASDLPDYKIRKVLICILQLCEAPKLQAEARWGAISIALAAIVSRHFHEDALKNQILDPIAQLLPSLPPQFQEKAKSFMTTNAPQLIVRLFPEVENKPQPAIPPQSVEPPLQPPLESSIQSSSPKSNEKPAVPRSGLVQQVTDWLNSLKGQSKLLDDLLQQIVQLEQQNSQLEGDLRTVRLKEESATAESAKSAASLSVAEEQIHRLEQQLKQELESAKQTHERAGALDVRLKATLEQESEIRKQLQTLEERANKERAELHQRVQTNADRRLDEFRNALASSLARLLQGLPKRGASLSDKDGAVILVRIYEIVSLLESKGVHIDVGQGGSR